MMPLSLKNNAATQGGDPDPAGNGVAKAEFLLHPWLHVHPRGELATWVAEACDSQYKALVRKSIK
jgi:hypothetical protein